MQSGSRDSEERRQKGAKRTDGPEATLVSKVQFKLKQKKTVQGVNCKTSPSRSDMVAVDNLICTTVSSDMKSLFSKTYENNKPQL